MRSLRVQILAVLVLVGLLSTIVINCVILSSYRSETIDCRSDEIRREGESIAQALLNYDFFSKDTVVQNQLELRSTIGMLEKSRLERIMIVSGSKLVYDTKTHGEDSVISNIPIKEIDEIFEKTDIDAMQQSYDTQKSQIYETKQVLRCIIPVEAGSEKQNAGYVILDTDMDDVLSGYNTMHEKIIVIEIILFALIVLFAFFYSHKVKKPFEELIMYISRITEGYLDEKVTMHSFTEIEDVVDSINSMTTKLETLESSRQEFVSNVSHELKTPITSIKVLADSLLQQEDAPAELYREFLVDINAEIERENKIITDLLSLVKMDKTTSDLNIAPVNINELCEQILKRIKPIAVKRNIELVFESYRPVMAEVDEVKLSLAINNLVENAVKYNYDNGWVRVSLNADHKFFYIKVADSGVGIPEDEQENVFERFYRVDKARSRETGGTGLGLSITRNAILIHRGAIKIYSKEKEGTTFTVRIPLTYTN